MDQPMSVDDRTHERGSRLVSKAPARRARVRLAVHRKALAQLVASDVIRCDCLWIEPRRFVAEHMLSWSFEGYMVTVTDPHADEVGVVIEVETDAATDGSPILCEGFRLVLDWDRSKSSDGLKVFRLEVIDDLDEYETRVTEAMGPVAEAAQAFAGGRNAFLSYLTGIPLERVDEVTNGPCTDRF